MASRSPSLNEMADELAGLINEDFGTEHDHLSGTEILDYLALLGYTLVPDPIGDSSVSYFERIEEDLGRDGSISGD